MISNVTRLSNFNDKPLYRLESEAHTVLWIKSLPGRRLVARALHQLYPEGVAVCSDTCRLMGVIDNRGRITEIPVPWPEFPICQMINNPDPEIGSSNECPCFDYYDPEVGGPWRERGLNTHHPFCMYRERSLRRYQHFCSIGKPAERPDAWYKSSFEI
jgi:hypothetical protein